MPVVLMSDTPNMNAEQFDAVLADIGAELPAGCHLRVAGPGPDGGWRVVSVWDDAETAKAFIVGTARPAQERAGVQLGPPNLVSWPLHNLTTA